MPSALLSLIKSYSGYPYLASDEKRELQTIIERAVLAAREQERQKVTKQLAQEYASKVGCDKFRGKNFRDFYAWKTWTW